MVRKIIVKWSFVPFGRLKQNYFGEIRLQKKTFFYWTLFSILNFSEFLKSKKINVKLIDCAILWNWESPIFHDLWCFSNKSKRVCIRVSDNNVMTEGFLVNTISRWFKKKEWISLPDDPIKKWIPRIPLRRTET